MPFEVQTPLPIDASLDEVRMRLERDRALVVVAPPGSGKTTRIPPALLQFGRTILLQPRRVAARALTRRIASEHGWTVGREIGWQIRGERNFSGATRLLVATEGILTARLQSDPLLSDFAVVVIDEFHERSIHADLALALVRQAAMSRDDLRVVVMSATMDAEPVGQFIGGTVLRVDARTYPVDVRYSPGASVADAVVGSLPATAGDILCFLPGAREIEKARTDILSRIGDDVLVLPLHGSLDVDEQERAIAPASKRKVIVATNVAETSLTVDGVTVVVDSGLHKVLRYDANTAIDHLELEQITADSATQRAGRAGRTAPGLAIRLWDARSLLREFREPEIRRVDLAGPVLEIIAWGGDPETFEWFERPPDHRIAAALELLRALGAIDGRKITPLGEEMHRLPMHPRLARLLIAADWSDDAVRLVEEISGEKVEMRGRRDAGAPAGQRPALRTAAAFQSRQALERAAVAAYPDRVAMRRSPGADDLVLASGTGARLGRECEIPGDFLVALEVRDGIVRRALSIEREWLEPTRTDVVHAIERERVRATQRRWYGGILLHEQFVPPDPDVEREMLELERLRRADPQKALRARFAGVEISSRDLGRLAPESLKLPSGRSAKLEYRDDSSVIASAKLQELFGLAETPRIGPNRTPVTFALLSPAGRPVQVTQDLRNFWNTTYAEVRKELRGRYPRHPWPDDPWNAVATHRTTKKS